MNSPVCACGSAIEMDRQSIGLRVCRACALKNPDDFINYGKTGVELIAQERRRQIEKEGWTPTHDKYEQDSGALAIAAACYALPADKVVVGGSSGSGQISWPWDVKWYKRTPTCRVRDLVKAGALIAAEIDRLRDEEAL